MGVTGLWQLIAPAGKPVTLESLENKVLAVDVSIWLNQAVKGFRDSSGHNPAHAHLVTLCNRICKLLFYRIKPIFVFDGATPQLKKQTLIAREKQRQSSTNNLHKTAHRILTNYLATEVVQGKGKKKQKKTRDKVGDARRDDDIFRLPPIDQTSALMESDEEEEDEEEAVDRGDALRGAFVEAQFQDLASVDVNSADFKNLPPDVRYELLSAMKDNRRRTHHTPLPQDSEEFSSFQMSRLLERSRLQRGMEAAVKELNQRQVGELMTELCQDEITSDMHRIVSEDAAHVVLIHKTSKQQQETGGTSSQKSSVLEDMNEFIFTSSEEEEVSVLEELSAATNTSNKIPSLSPVRNSLNVDHASSVTSKSRQKASVSESAIQIFPISNSAESSTRTKRVNAIEAWFQDLQEKETKDDKPDNVPQTIVDNSVGLTANEENAVLLSSDSDDTETKLEQTDNLNMESSSTGIVSCEIRENVPLSSGANETNPQHLNTKKEQNSNVEIVSCEISEKVPLPSRTNQSVRKSQSPQKDITSIETKDQNTDINDIRDVVPNSKDDSVNISTQTVFDSPAKDIMQKVTLTVHLDKPEMVDLEDDLFPPEIFEAPLLQEEKTHEDDVQLILPKKLLRAQNQEEALAVLEAEREQLLQERGRHQRQAQTLSDQIVIESQELLRLFGVPYIVSPTEAEAQCAALESLKLTQGTITEDSDIWLFGGQRVYKNIFHQDKYVQLYTKEDIYAHFGLDRDQLICFAMLTGSDYTPGVEGAGAVTAMEILAEFKAQGIQTLSAFKSWWASHHQKKAAPGNAVRAKLSSLHLPDSFPREDVFKAYLNPEVDQSNEKFSWNVPDLCALRELLNGKLGWKMEKVNDMLLPVIKKCSQNQSQTRLDSFFSSVTLKPESVVAPSKRLQKALQKVKPKAFPVDTKPSSDREKKGRGKANMGRRGTNRKRMAVEDGGSSSDPDDPKISRKGAPQQCVLSEDSSDS